MSNVNEIKVGSVIRYVNHGGKNKTARVDGKFGPDGAVLALVAEDVDGTRHSLEILSGCRVLGVLNNPAATAVFEQLHEAQVAMNALFAAKNNAK